MKWRLLVLALALTSAVTTIHADWCPPCQAAVTVESQFQRVSAIARCGFCGFGTTAYNTAVTVSGSLTLTPDGARDTCRAPGYCGMSSYADPMRASTTYTATGTFTASQAGFDFSTMTVSGSATSPPPALPPGDPTKPADKCDGETGFGQPCSPILINVANGSYDLSGADDPVWFDIDADGTPERLTWTARDSAVAFLALDRNANGIIDDGSELFGDATWLRRGERAANGFEALRELDSNSDDLVDDADDAWYGLLLWTDANHDGTSQPDEIVSIDGSAVNALETSYHWTGRRDAYGNLYRFQSIAHLTRGTRAVYDVYFRGVK